MRGSKRCQSGSSKPEMLAWVSLFIFCGLAGASAVAADLDHYPAAPPPAVVARPCRLVPMPEANIAGEVVRFRRTWVCVSRGLYADSLPPPPPLPRPWWWLW